MQQTSDEYPVNLNSIWMLVYGRKEEATRALTSDTQFIEGIDYKVIRKNAENPKGGRPVNEYKLSVSCMEFFIARKVRMVFEVYRQVFHKVSSGGISRKELALMVIQAEEDKERLQLENSLLLKEKEEAKPAIIFTESVKVCNTYILIRDLAKIITQNGYKIGERRLYEWMVENNYLIKNKRWSKTNNRYVFYYTPTQSATERQLFWVSERPITNPGQQPFMSFTCYVTGEGQVFFVNKFKNLKVA